LDRLAAEEAAHRQMQQNIAISVAATGALMLVRLALLGLVRKKKSRQPV
jgi:hypothetical protein